jgi:hypothetical protein
MAFPLNRGVSDSAHELERRVEDLQGSLAQTITIGGLYGETRRSIAAASKWAEINNWDGYGAKPVDPESCLNALLFSKLLPMGVPIPEIEVDTEGEIRFEWYRSPRQILSVAVGGDGELAYAGLFGASKIHGTEYLIDELPNVILDNINRVYS